MKRNSCILILLILILLVPNTLGLCTVTLDESEYIPGQLAAAAMQCDSNSEKNTAYTLTWYDQLGGIIQTDSGITPSSAGQFFFESLLIPSNITSGSANLTGAGLEGEDSFIVTTFGNGTLLLTNFVFTDPLYLGKSAGVTFEIYNSNNESVSGAVCTLAAEDGTGLPTGVPIQNFESYDGNAQASEIITLSALSENRDYVISLHCNYDSTGDGLVDQVGSVKIPFMTSKWLNVTTNVDKSLYSPRDQIFVCANLTNIDYPVRVSTEIYHQIRCSAYDDNNLDNDRALIVSDDMEPDIRGINVNTTQKQCKGFVIPDRVYLQGHNNSCYASTVVNVIDEQGELMVSYATTSEIFNVVSEELNINPDWERDNINKWSTEVNLSNGKYKNWNGTGIGNIDLAINTQLDTIQHQDQFTIKPLDIQDFLNTRKIKNYKVYDINGTELNSKLEYLDDGNIEIEIRNVDMSQNGYYTAEITFETSEGNNMLAIIISSITVIFIYGSLAWINFKLTINREDEVYWVFVASSILALLQMVFMLSLIYADYIGTDLTSLLYMNFILNFILIMGITLMTLARSLLYLGTPVTDDDLDTRPKWQKSRWK